MNLWTDQPWHTSGACNGSDPDAWFPDSRATATAAIAQRICHTCPVMDECADWAINTREAWGVWGATTESDRKAIWRQEDDERARAEAETA
jgi:WhiB family redox-sensing transcriptional regulator